MPDHDSVVDLSTPFRPSQSVLVGSKCGDMPEKAEKERCAYRAM
jgi:hypothetical protein